MRVAIEDGCRLFFDIAGSRLARDDAGVTERPTIVALHGGPGNDHTSLRPALDRLAEVAQVVYVDQRGNGRSDGHDDPSGWCLDRWADDVVALCEALEIERPIVLGHSFGAMVAMRYAGRHPEHPAALVLISSAARWVPSRAFAAFERLGGAKAREVAERFWDDPGDEEAGSEYTSVCLPLYDQTPAPPDTAITNKAMVRHFVAGEMKSADLREDLARVRCPTLVLAGRLDPICPPNDHAEILKSLPLSLGSLSILDEAGHYPFRDRPDQAFAVLAGFLRDLAGGP